MCMGGVLLPYINRHRQICFWADTTRSHASNFSELLIDDVALAALVLSKEKFDMSDSCPGPQLFEEVGVGGIVSSQPGNPWVNQITTKILVRQASVL